MTDTQTVTAGSGELLIRTGVTGKAARTGHRLTIAVTSWQAQVTVDDGHPSAVTLTVDVDSLDVIAGEGGLTPMGGAEKALARKNALKAFDAGKYPQITYVSSGVERDGDRYTVSGELTVHGVTRSHPLTVTADGDAFRCESAVIQSEFGIKPYSQMMGALKVADEVTVEISATL
ncbi:YceI family protein [Gordonia sp. VNK21]|uniref:YceI family protein n=1 Tax=Gordonia sp. VNK21 TaxID=3382483 RepID=UPI0038D42E7D